MLKRANYQLYSALMTLDAIRGNQDNYMEERATQLRGNTSASLLPLRHQSLTRKFIFKGKKLIDSWIILIFFYQFQFKQNFNRSVPSLFPCLQQVSKIMGKIYNIFNLFLLLCKYKNSKLLLCFCISTNKTFYTVLGFLSVLFVSILKLKLLYAYISYIQYISLQQMSF